MVLPILVVSPRADTDPYTYIYTLHEVILLRVIERAAEFLHTACKDEFRTINLTADVLLSKQNSSYGGFEPCPRRACQSRQQVRRETPENYLQPERMIDFDAPQ